jgi:hypothetical protein
MYFVNTSVIDMDGRYGFVVDKGNYYIDVSHQDFVMADKSIFGKVFNEKEGFYLGGNFSIEKVSGIDYNIPLQPLQLSFGLNRQTLLYVWNLFKRLALITQSTVFIVTFLLLNFFFSLIFRDNPIYLILVGFYCLLLFMKIYIMIFNEKAKSWGIILEQENLKPLKNAFVKLFDSTKGILIDTKIADEKGRFQVLLKI